MDVKVEHTRNTRLLGHTDLNGSGDGSQIMRHGDHIYVGHMGYNGIGTSVVDVRDPREPKVVNQIPIPRNTHSHKVQTADDLLLVNHEQQLRAGEPYSAGLAIYSIEEPASPTQIGWLPIDGQGVHRMWWDGGDLVYFSAREVGRAGRFLMIADISRPEKPEIIDRWWYPGQWIRGGEEPTWAEGPTVRAHHVIVQGDRAYGGYGDAGFMVFDVSGGKYRLISQREWSGAVGGSTHTHTGLPLLTRNVVAVTDEPLKDYCEEPKKLARLFDVSDEANPRLVGVFPEPAGRYCDTGGRYGPHNFHENRAGTFVSEDVVFLTYFNAGLRIYDVRDPRHPVEVGSFQPAPPDGQQAIQINDVLVSSDGIAYVSDRLAGGVYILELSESLRS